MSLDQNDYSEWLQSGDTEFFIHRSNLQGE